MQFQLSTYGSLFHFPLWGVVLLALFVGLFCFVAGGVFGPKLFQKIGLPGLALGVQFVETLDQKLKKLSADLVAKQQAAALLGLPPEQLDAKISAAVAEHFAAK